MSRKNSNDYGRLHKALRLRQGLLESKSFGPDIQSHRHLGIVIAGDDTESAYLEEDFCEEEQVEFASEAEEILERARAIGMQAEILHAEVREDVLSFIGEISMTDVLLIGHGQLGSYRLSAHDLNWWHIARSRDHLKQGYFVQRHCGVLWQKLNVAVGTFSVSDMRHVIAPVGQYFVPTSLDDEANGLLRPVYQEPHHTYQDLVEMYPKSSAVANYS